MASLSDQIDRLSRNTRAIRSTAANTAASVAGPFTRAVLTAHLGDLIRDIDPSELGLFSLQSHAAPTPEISRAEFTGATPLRKPSSRRDDAPKAKEPEPEIYVEAALKCIDRYYAIRPMPRAHSQAAVILERLSLVRENVQTLTETLQQAQSVEGPSLKSLIDDEEKRLRNLQARFAELSERKKNAMSASHALPGKRPAQVRSKPKPKAPPLSPQEDSIWNTPAAAARTLRFTDNLMDEQVDLGDITTNSFSSPILPSKTGTVSPLTAADDSSIRTPTIPLNFNEEKAMEGDQEAEDEQSGGDGGEEEHTVVLRNPHAAPETPEPRPSLPMPQAEESVPETSLSTPSDTPSATQAKARIWTTIGAMMMPGHPPDTPARGIGSKPPRAKEIIAHLQYLSASPPPLASPSASSVSSASAGLPAPPTSQQILTAYLLLSLLSSPPHFSLPLNKAKELLAAKASTGGSVGAVAQGTTRILYGRNETPVLLIAGDISFSPILSMCVVSRTSPLLVAVWSSPALFEIFVLTSTAWNAFSRPRDAQLPLTRALHRDGLTFFVALTILRMVNLGLSTTFRPELVLLAVFLVWSMTTMILNRSLLRMKRAGLLDELQDEMEHDVPDPRTQSPFAARPRLQADALLEQPDFEMYELDKEHPGKADSERSKIGAKSPWYTVNW
ncbi:hypothetical protein D9615_002432 [Tricholomella constricta]|uniref:Uncharacterized protein n=1 Tax=Tricholomella constricta TaxID=117010 RepID=A0A8H5MA02_9AGAR|nr:hypothetical protein D9615_002432 [Tricholomella constricta]